MNKTEAIKAALGPAAYRSPVSSTKSMTGYMMGATGAVEAIICVQAIRTERIPLEEALSPGTLGVWIGALRERRVLRDYRHLQETLTDGYRVRRMVGQSEAMKEVLARVEDCVAESKGLKADKQCPEEITAIMGLSTSPRCRSSPNCADRWAISGLPAIRAIAAPRLMERPIIAAEYRR